MNRKLLSSRVGVNPGFPGSKQKSPQSMKARRKRRKIKAACPKKLIVFSSERKMLHNNCPKNRGKESRMFSFCSPLIEKTSSL